MPGERVGCQQSGTLAPGTMTKPGSPTSNIGAARNPLGQVKSPDPPTLVDHLQT